jgi:hypothetical protein
MYLTEQKRSERRKGENKRRRRGEERDKEKRKEGKERGDNDPSEGSSLGGGWSSTCFSKLSKRAAEGRWRVWHVRKMRKPTGGCRRNGEVKN